MVKIGSLLLLVAGSSNSPASAATYDQVDILKLLETFKAQNNKDDKVGLDSSNPKQVDYCVTGYLMDKYCITQGKLFDNPTLDTLLYPQNHSVMCLIDVPDCLASGYEVLVKGSGTEYQRKVLLDSADALLTYARALGVCPSCTGAGTIATGLRATVKGTIGPAAVFDPSNPPVLRVTSVEPDSIPCPRVADAADATTTVAAASGKEYCVTGYLMDKYCIASGKLFDNPTLDTLSHPQNHSVMCLIEVPDCLASGYEVLVRGSGMEYQRNIALDSSDMVVQYAKQFGSCPSCSGAIATGLQATVKGTIDPNTVNSEVPTLMVRSIESADVRCTMSPLDHSTTTGSTASSKGGKGRSKGSKRGKGGKGKGGKKDRERGGKGKSGTRKGGNTYDSHYQEARQRNRDKGVNL